MAMPHMLEAGISSTRRIASSLGRAGYWDGAKMRAIGRKCREGDADPADIKDQPAGSMAAQTRSAASGKAGVE
ncbi:hypothetical protein LL251_08880 [Sphingobium naphthae]|nr:hypothetical protein [Sphingobium naphthae]